MLVILPSWLEVSKRSCDGDNARWNDNLSAIASN